MKACYNTRVTAFFSATKFNIIKVASCPIIKLGRPGFIFSIEKELEVMKTLAGLMAQQINPHMKVAIDGRWLVYSVAKLYDSWKRPGCNTSLCVYKAVRLLFNTFCLLGDCYMQLKVAAYYTHTVNFILKSVEARLQCKSLPFKDLLLSIDQQLTLPLNLLKATDLARKWYPKLCKLAAVSTCLTSKIANLEIIASKWGSKS